MEKKKNKKLLTLTSVRRKSSHPIATSLVELRKQWEPQGDAAAAAVAAAKSLHSCPTLCDPIDGSPPGSSIHGISQTRVLEWGAIAFSTRRCTDTQLDKGNFPT